MDKWIILHLRARIYLRIIVLPLGLLIGLKLFRLNCSEKMTDCLFGNMILALMLYFVLSLSLL